MNMLGIERKQISNQYVYKNHIASLTFTPLACKRIIMITGRPIAAHQTQFLLLSGRWSFLCLFGITAIARAVAI